MTDVSLSRAFAPNTTRFASDTGPLAVVWQNVLNRYNYSTFFSSYATENTKHKKIQLATPAHSTSVRCWNWLNIQIGDADSETSAAISVLDSILVVSNGM